MNLLFYDISISLKLFPRIKKALWCYNLTTYAGRLDNPTYMKAKIIQYY